MKKPSRLDYAFSVGKVRALEKRLVSKAVFGEAADEDDFQSAVKIIFDAGAFSEEMIEIKDSKALDEYLEKEGKNLRILMDELLLEKDILRILDEDERPQNKMLLAPECGYAFIRDYLRHRIDLANIKIFCRIKYSGLSREKLENLILKGGFLDEKILLQSFELSFSEIGERIQATPYRELWTKATDTLEQEETFVVLERGIEDFLMKYLQRAKHIVFGPEPVFAYGLAKRRELNLVRLVGIGKLTQIPSQILKERISETYV
jgi:V/A-type H+-transporting ATPase subunit C